MLAPVARLCNSNFGPVFEPAHGSTASLSLYAAGARLGATSRVVPRMHGFDCFHTVNLAAIAQPCDVFKQLDGVPKHVGFVFDEPGAKASLGGESNRV